MFGSDRITLQEFPMTGKQYAAFAIAVLVMIVYGYNECGFAGALGALIALAYLATRGGPGVSGQGGRQQYGRCRRGRRQRH